jgi:hypothetical protein
VLRSARGQLGAPGFRRVSRECRKGFSVARLVNSGHRVAQANGCSRLFFIFRCASSPSEAHNKARRHVESCRPGGNRGGGWRPGLRWGCEPGLLRARVREGEQVAGGDVRNCLWVLPICFRVSGRTARKSSKSLEKLARPRGVEPLTPRSVVWCSIQLSYGRMPGREAVAGAQQLPHRAAAAQGRRGPASCRYGVRRQL